MLTAEIIPSVKVKHAKDTTDNSKVWFDYWAKHVKELLINSGIVNVVTEMYLLMKW